MTTLTTNPSSLLVKANDGTISPLNDATTLDRYWTLTETGDLSADVTFNYLQADVDGTETNYRTIRVIGGSVAAFPNGAPCPGVGSPCVDPTANTIFVRGLQAFSDWTAGELTPTAAAVTVSGRVVTPEGRGLTNALVSMVGADGNSRISRTSSFGYFRFFDVPVGETYNMKDFAYELEDFHDLVRLTTDRAGLPAAAVERTTTSSKH